MYEILKQSLLIVLFAIADLVLFVFLIYKLKKIQELIKPCQRVVNKVPIIEDEHLEDKFKEQLKTINMLYSFFSNIVSIFPLLGMFGTVWALYNSADSFSEVSNNIDLRNFFSALSTTLAGIICAVSGKMADAYISPDIIDINKEYDLFTDRYTEQNSGGKK